MTAALFKKKSDDQSSLGTISQSNGLVYMGTFYELTFQLIKLPHELTCPGEFDTMMWSSECFCIC